MGAGREEEKAPSLRGHPEQGALLEALPQPRWAAGGGHQEQAGHGSAGARAEPQRSGRTADKEGQGALNSKEHRVLCIHKGSLCTQQEQDSAQSGEAPHHQAPRAAVPPALRGMNGQRKGRVFVGPENWFSRPAPNTTRQKALGGFWEWLYRAPVTSKTMEFTLGFKPHDCQQPPWHPPAPKCTSQTARGDQSS